VYGHFAEAIEAGLLDPLEVLPIEKSEYAFIAQTLELVNSCEEGRLKTLYEALDEAYEYGLLKCILAAECH
ncbi:MAG: helix-turn-helix domain-containing protein, partial [Chromatiales bacterium]|nr:helix-turn-helix domain-containing protein [Chromatiales bacterium]